MSGMKSHLVLYSILILVVAADCSAADSSDYFEQHIRPLLIEHCYQCHSPTKQVKGGLRLDSKQGWQQGGDTGPAIVPGKPDESLLIKAIRYQDADLRMPPSEKLSDAQIARLEEWVRIGAPDPREAPTSPIVKSTQPTSSEHWAFQPLKNFETPLVRNSQWPRNQVDSFILAGLDEKRLTPSPDANRWQWLRRVTFDLIGLPPTPAEIQDFTNDTSPDACERVVDRLLASPAFGERWARPWLDLVGYADQIGSANNVPAEHAWRYRDYVIRSMSADKPFDEFIREQIAGDLLMAGSIEQRQDQIIATGFLVLGNVNIVEGDKLVMQMDLVDQQIEKTGKAFLGLTLNCVRCHDHKFDPITLRDYYGLAGIFASTDSTYRDDRGVWSSVTKSQLPETLEDFTRRQSQLHVHDQKVANLRQEQLTLDLQQKALQQSIKAAKESADQATARPVAELEQEQRQLTAKLASLEQKLWHLNYNQPAPPLAFSVREAAEIADARIQVRGNPHTLGPSVPRGFVQVASHGSVPAIEPSQSGRLSLATWLSESASPLVSRVAVNRIWSRLFGRGIVASVDYFGIRGDQPTNPGLLDQLAADFLVGGRSQKRMIRQLANSRTYRQSAEVEADHGNAISLDPDNHLLWRMSPRRLDAEMLRDAILAVSGQLEDCRGGPALVPEFPENVGGLNPKDVNPISFSLSKFRDNQQRLRTVYLPIVRSSDQRGPADVLNFFDFPQPARFAGDRSATTVASQTLFLLNGPLLKSASRQLADKLTANVALNGDANKLRSLYLTVLNRAPLASEISAAIEFLYSPEDVTVGDPSAADLIAAPWQRLIHALMATNEFLFRL